MAEKRARKAAGKARATRPVAKKTQGGPAVNGSGSSPRSASVGISASGPRLVCPRCGTAKFGPERRTRVEGTRTVRYSVLVCERGHTFARAVSRG